MPTYVISGLAVKSEVALPSVGETDLDARSPDVVIRRGAVPNHLMGADHVQPAWQLKGKDILLLVPNLIRILIRDGREMVIATECGSDEAEGLVFVVSNAFGILLQQRGGIMVLHASAVVVNGQALAFCGPSGVGKSTLAAALCHLGHALASDDMCAVVLDAYGRPFLQPDGRSLELWENSLQRLALQNHQGRPLRRHLTKYYVTPPARAASELLPLAALYVLRAAKISSQEGIRPLGLIEAMQAIRANTYRSLLIKHLGQESAHFSCATQILSTTPVFGFGVSQDWGRLQQNVELLCDHWRVFGEASR